MYVKRTRRDSGPHQVYTPQDAESGLKLTIGYGFAARCSAIMRAALDKVDWEEIAEALQEGRYPIGVPPFFVRADRGRDGRNCRFGRRGLRDENFDRCLKYVI